MLENSNLKIDLNSDLGESWGEYAKGEDNDVLKIITSANICLLYTSDAADE